jgi:iron complex outermembrane recepter protein
MALAFAMTASGVAAADEAAASKAAGAAEVGEVVVTATRRSESLSKVPVSVSAFTAEKLENQGVKSFADLAKFTPGVNFNVDSNNISIRGVQSSAGSGTTGIYIDDTPIQVRNLGLNANNSLPNIFDLQRVEVLRGPQGTLFGAGSEGGTVRYITTQPSLTTFSGKATAEVAATEHGGASYEFGAAVGGPIVPDKLGLRISAWGRRDGGWIDWVDYQTGAVKEQNANRSDTYVLRAAATWAPAADLRITPSITYQKRDLHKQDNYIVALSDPGAGRYVDATPERMGDPDRYYLMGLKIDWTAGPVKVTSDTSYFNRKERVQGYSGTLYNLSYFQHFLAPTTALFGYPDGPADPAGNTCDGCGSFYPLLTPTGPNAAALGPLAGYQARNVITNRQEDFTQEVRFQSNQPSSRLQWTTGVFFSFNRQRSTEEIQDPQLPQLTQYLWGEDMVTAWGENLLANGDDYINDTSARDRQIALFADVTYSLTHALKLNVGLRQAWTKFSFTNINDGPQDLLFNGGVPNASSGGESEHPFTPKFSLSYQITSDDMVYATVSKGYRIGGATPPLPEEACGGKFPETYQSDSLWSYELGTKDRFFDRKLQIAASGYYIKWSNIQQAIYVSQCGIQFTANAGEAESKGFDFQGQWQVTRALSLEASLGYTDAHFTKLVYVPNTVGQNPIVSPGDVLDVSPWTATLAAQYKFNLGSHDGFARVDYEFQSKRTGLIPNEDQRNLNYDPGLVPDPAIHQMSLRAGLEVSSWNVEVFINNLLDSHRQQDLNHQDRATLLYEASIVRPRTFGLQIDRKF